MLQLTADAVPREFTVRAFDLRDRLKRSSGDYAERVRRICLLLSVQLRRYRDHKPHTLSLAVEQWRRAPEFGRIGKLQIRRVPRGLYISELRVADCLHFFDYWDPSHREKGLEVVRITMTAADREFKLDSDPKANLSIHALARRYQRGWGDSDDAVLADIAELATHDELLKDHKFSLPLQVGSWVGERVLSRTSDGKEYRSLAVRTFLLGETPRMAAA